MKPRLVRQFFLRDPRSLTGFSQDLPKSTAKEVVGILGKVSSRRHNLILPWRLWYETETIVSMELLDMKPRLAALSLALAALCLAAPALIKPAVPTRESAACPAPITHIEPTGNDSSVTA